MVGPIAPVKRSLGRIPLMDLTEDAIFGGRVRLKQPRHGYRANVDTILLGAAIYPPDAGKVIDLGCGVGGALLVAAVRWPDTHFVGVERDASYAALARENAALNVMTDRVSIHEADALAPPRDWGVFDGVFFNPPYDREGEGRPPSEVRRSAYISDAPVGDWIKIWSNRMSADAAMTLIQRTHRLPEILDALEGRLGGVEIFPIRPAPNASARRIIVRARKGSRAPLRLWAGLDLHPDGASKDKYTPETEAILRGGAPLWFG